MLDIRVESQVRNWVVRLEPVLLKLLHVILSLRLMCLSCSTSSPRWVNSEVGFESPSVCHVAFVY